MLFWLEEDSTKHIYAISLFCKTCLDEYIYYNRAPYISNEPEKHFSAQLGTSLQVTFVHPTSTHAGNSVPCHLLQKRRPESAFAALVPEGAKNWPHHFSFVVIIYVDVYFSFFFINVLSWNWMLFSQSNIVHFIPSF